MTVAPASSPARRGPPADAIPDDDRCADPTDEPLTLPARLIGTFPVDDTRRRLAAGPLGDYLLERAADIYVELMAGDRAGGSMEVVAGRRFSGRADRCRAARRGAPPGRGDAAAATAAGDLVTPGDACQLPGLGADGAALFGQAIPGLLPPVSSAAATVLRGLGVADAELVAGQRRDRRSSSVIRRSGGRCTRRSPLPNGRRIRRTWRTSPCR